MLELNGLDVGYRGQRVVKDVNLTFRRGEITTIIGKNGSGKSTLLKTTCKLLKPLAGRVSLEGEDQREYGQRRWAQKLSYLSQSRSESQITVRALVMHGRYPHLGFSRSAGPQDYQIVEKALKQLGIEQLQDKSLSQISGGERQKAYLAMALAQDTPYIALDEPATSLDLSVQREMLKLLLQLKQEGKAVIAVMHDLSGALEISDQVCLLDRGKVASYGPTRQIVSSGVIEEVFSVSCMEIQREGNPLYLFS